LEWWFINQQRRCIAVPRAKAPILAEFEHKFVQDMCGLSVGGRESFQSLNNLIHFCHFLHGWLSSRDARV